MNARQSLILILSGWLAGCAIGYTLVAQGTVAVGDLNVRAGPGWNKVPAAEIPWARRGTVAWTQEGMMLDRLVIITRVVDGDSIYLRRNNIDYPAFDKNMTGDQLQDLVKSTIELAQQTNRAEVETGSLRSHQFGTNAGFLFDLRAAVLDGPEYRGTVGAFVADDRLYLLYFIGAVPHYFEKHIASAEAVIRSAIL